MTVAFQQESVPGLSSDAAIREQKNALIERIARTITENYPVPKLLQELKEKSATHYYHGLRVGVKFLDMIES